MSEETKNKIWTVIGILLLIIVIYLLSTHTHFIELLLHRSGAWAPLVAILLYPLLAPTPITTDPITVIMGVVYGPLIGLTYAWIGNTLAALVEYYIGTKLQKVTNFEKAKGKIPFGLGKLPVNSVGFLVFGRMIPGYGGKIISILAGMYKVPLKRYLWTTAITNLFGAIILSYGGSSLVKIIRILKGHSIPSLRIRPSPSILPVR
jgi:uncharacterized membrane protein YdjX (TVP38/TMEM64 family)